MHPADIKACLTKAGLRQSTLAKRLRVTQPAVFLVINGGSKSRRIAEAISAATCIPVKDLWPGRYPALEKEQAMAARGGAAAAVFNAALRSARAGDTSSPTPVSEKKRA